MKAILRWGTALVSLLLLTQISAGYVWVTPVFKCPYPQAPSPSNSGFYLLDSEGRWTGPHYYLVPPGKPFGGMLPGQTGQMIMSGYLPHTHLLSKEGLAIGKVPLVGDKASAGHAQGAPMPGAGLPELNGQGGMMASPYGNPYGAPAYGNPYAAPQYRNMQVPYPIPGMPQQGPMPYAGAQMPYPMAMPYAGGPMPYPMPQGPMAMPYAGGPMPYPMPNGMMPYPMPQGPMPMMAPGRPMAWQNGTGNIWLAQNVAPNIPPMPNFAPGMPGPPMMPGMPTTPGGQVAPMNTFPFFGPMQQFPPFGPLQGPALPQMNAAPLQAPRMEMYPPPPQKPATAFPMHPFTRSPRDFFMWSETMEDEQRLRNRPFPVPR